MYAVRIQVGGKVVEYSDDDGEYGGSSVILQDLRDSDITGRRVVVSRRASGVRLGPRRWEIIKQCTKDAITS